jgi:hypothetical protein
MTNIMFMVSRGEHILLYLLNWIEWYCIVLYVYAIYAIKAFCSKCMYVVTCLFLSLFFVSVVTEIGGRCYGDRDSTFGVAGNSASICIFISANLSTYMLT